MLNDQQLSLGQTATIQPEVHLPKHQLDTAHPAAAITATTASVVKDLNLDSYAEERLATCIANFVDGYAAGWFFSVPEAFKDTLDIQATQRMFDGKPHIILTQGKLFSFSRGDVIYADRKASRFCVQVKD